MDISITQNKDIKNIKLNNNNEIIITLTDNSVIALSYHTAQTIRELAETQSYRQEIIDYFTIRQNIYHNSILRNNELINDITGAYQHNYECALYQIPEREYLENAIDDEKDALERYKIKNKK